MMLLLGCAAAVREELARSEAEGTARVATAPELWAPDVTLVFPVAELEKVCHILVDDVLDNAPGVGASLAPGLPTVAVRPRLSVRELHLAPIAGWADRLQADGVLTGTVGAEVGGRSMGVPVEARLRLRLRLEVVDGLAVMARLSEIEEVAVGTVAGQRLRPKRGRIVEDFVREQLRMQPIRIPIAVLGGERGLPVVDARVEVRGAQVVLSLRTDVPTDANVRPALAPEGLALTMADPTLLGIVRREVWKRASSSIATFVEPRSMDLAGERYTAVLRLWNPGFPAWWQDFQLDGTMRVEGGRLRVGFEELEPRLGSGWFGSGRVIGRSLLDALGEIVTGRIDTGLPGEVGKAIRTVDLGAEVTSIEDAPGGFVVRARVNAARSAKR